MPYPTTLGATLTITPHASPSPSNAPVGTTPAYQILVNDGKGSVTTYTQTADGSPQVINLGATGRFQVESMIGPWALAWTQILQGDNFNDHPTPIREQPKSTYQSTLSVAPTPGVTQPINANYDVHIAGETLPNGSGSLVGPGTNTVQTATPALTPLDHSTAIYALNGTYDFTTTVTGNFSASNPMPLIAAVPPSPEINGDNEEGSEGGSCDGCSIWLLILVALGIVLLIYLAVRSVYVAAAPPTGAAMGSSSFTAVTRPIMPSGPVYINV